MEAGEFLGMRDMVRADYSGMAEIPPRNVGCRYVLMLFSQVGGDSAGSMNARLHIAPTSHVLVFSKLSTCPCYVCPFILPLFRVI